MMKSKNVTNWLEIGLQLVVVALLAALVFLAGTCFGGCRVRSAVDVGDARFGGQVAVSGLEDKSESESGEVTEADPIAAERDELRRGIEYARVQKARARSTSESEIWDDAIRVKESRLAQIDASQPKKAGGRSQATKADKSAAVTAAPEPSWFGMKKNAGPIVLLALMFLGWGLFVFLLKDANEAWGAVGPPVVAILWVFAAASGSWLLDAPLGGVYAGRALLSSACWAAVSLAAYRPGVPSVPWRVVLSILFAFLGWGFLPTAAS